VARYETTLSVIDLSLEDNITVSGYIKWYQNYVFYFNREMGRKIWTEKFVSIISGHLLIL
jgi:hypothetical protein